MATFPGFVSAIRLKRDEVPDFDSYPFSIPAIQRLDRLLLNPRVSFLIGENGSGKSTLLEDIAIKFGFNAEGGFFVPDEPEAALSPHRQMSALVLMHELVKENCQFLIATHSPILLSYPGAWIYQCSENGIERIEYEETDHYRVTRDFLNRHTQMLKHLLRDDSDQGELEFD